MKAPLHREIQIPRRRGALVQRPESARPAIEINLAVFNLSKTEEAADGLMAKAEKSAAWRPFAMWELGMLANRGVEPEKIHEFLSGYVHDPTEKTRYWTVE